MFIGFYFQEHIKEFMFISWIRILKIISEVKLKGGFKIIMFFSNAFNIKNPKEKDWFNIYLDSDNPLFIDPMLVFQTERPEFIHFSAKIKKFFRGVIGRVALLK